MSADNGIYILDLKDQSRVAYAACIENLWWSEDGEQEEIVPERVVEYFGNSAPMTSGQAIIHAHEMYEKFMEEDDFGILEYGISHIRIDKTWNEVSN